MEDFFDRLDKYMNFKELNDNQLTVKANLSVGSLGKQRKGSRGLSSDSIAKILLSCSDLSAEWLLVGSGPMIKKTIVDSEPVCQVNNCDFMAMIDRKDHKIIEMSEEIGRLKQEVVFLKKGGSFTPYNYAAEP